MLRIAMKCRTISNLQSTLSKKKLTTKIALYRAKNKKGSDGVFLRQQKQLDGTGYLMPRNTIQIGLINCQIMTYFASLCVQAWTDTLTYFTRQATIQGEDCFYPE